MSKQEMRRPNAVQALEVEQLIGGAVERARQVRELSLEEMEAVSGATGVKLPDGGGITVGLLAGNETSGISQLKPIELPIKPPIKKPPVIMGLMPPPPAVELLG
ncbi:hypothetical protein [Chitinimonas lacunae]|uniref:Uncharacterized protein n=1 Tax=Chitinimonas lacunae TaxID=1963018 RepID=A0ABV8MTT5_9NEIS